MEKIFSNVKVEVIQGDIAAQAGIEAVVNAANAQLQTGGGVAGAIHRAAGPELEKAGRSLAPIKPGQAVITEGFNLPNPWVIHCLGPVYGQDKPEDQLLASCYREALKLAEEKQIRSIAFPAISTGVFGYPLKDAAQVIMATVIAEIPRLHAVKHIRFVLYSEQDKKVFENILSQQTDYE